MNIMNVPVKIIHIANPVIGKTAPPYLGARPKLSFHPVGKSAFDELDGAFQ